MNIQMPNTLFWRLLAVCRALTIPSAAAFCILASPASAHLSAFGPMDEAVHYFDAVAYVKIDKATVKTIENQECGTQYTGHILHTFKPNPDIGEGKTITFSRHHGLVAGGKYILFFKYIKSPREIYDRFMDGPLRARPYEQVAPFIQCDGLVPGYEAMEDLFWRVKGHYVSVPLVIPGYWPEWAPIVEIHGEQYAEKKGLFRYLEELSKQDAAHPRSDDGTDTPK